MLSLLTWKWFSLVLKSVSPSNCISRTCIALPLYVLSQGLNLGSCEIMFRLQRDEWLVQVTNIGDHMKSSMMVQPGGSLLWVFKWLKRLIVEPQTFLEVWVLMWGAGRGMWVSLVCVCGLSPLFAWTVAACRKLSSWKTINPKVLKTKRLRESKCYHANSNKTPLMALGGR